MIKQILKQQKKIKFLLFDYSLIMILHYPPTPCCVGVLERCLLYKGDTAEMHAYNTLCNMNDPTLVVDSASALDAHAQGADSFLCNTDAHHYFK